MLQGQVFLKGWPYFLIFFKVWYYISFLHLEITLPFAFVKLCYAFEEKLYFTATIILCNKVILCTKN